MTNILEIIRTLNSIKCSINGDVHWEDITDAVEDLKKLRTQLIQIQEEVCSLPIDWNRISLGDVDPLNSIDDRFEQILYEEKTNDPS